MDFTLLWLRSTVGVIVAASFLSGCGESANPTEPRGTGGVGLGGQSGTGGAPAGGTGSDIGGSVGSTGGSSTVGSTGGSSGECDLGLAPWSGGDFQGTSSALLVYDNAEQDIHIALARYYVQVGVGESAVYRAGGFLVRRGTESACITDAARLEYTNSHHNWLDQVVATQGTRRYLFDLQLDSAGGTGWHYKIRAVEDAQTVWGPYDLEKTSGPTW